MLACKGVCVFQLVCLYYLIDLSEQLSFLNECDYAIKNEVSVFSSPPPPFQTEIAKRLNTICAQVIPFLSQEVSTCDCCRLLRLHMLLVPEASCNVRPCLRLWQHQQQVVQAVERAKQVTMAELNAVIGVRGLPGLPPTVCIPLLTLSIPVISGCRAC